MSSSSRALALLLATAAPLCACRTELLGPGTDDSDGPRVDAAVPPDLAAPRPPDLRVPPGLTDMTCMQQPPPTDGDMCPCGNAGLCRPATGRLVVQTQSFGGTLRIRVMDDNGCRPADIATDYPLGPPRWSHDGQRVAYLTAAGQTSILHVLRVDNQGGVTCSLSTSTGLSATDVSWGSDPSQVWLFSPSDSTLMLFSLKIGALQRSMLDATRFDTVGDGPLADVRKSCTGGACDYSVEWRDSVAAGKLATVLPTSAMFTPMMPARFGPVRLSPSRDQLTFEIEGVSEGFALGKLAAGAMWKPLGKPGDRSPSFALDGHAIVYTNDAGALRYLVLDGAEAGKVLDVPPQGWKSVFSPEWTGITTACAASDCTQ